MRGADQNQDGMFSYLSPAARVPKDHPLRPIKKMVSQALSPDIIINNGTLPFRFSAPSCDVSNDLESRSKDTLRISYKWFSYRRAKYIVATCNELREALSKEIRISETNINVIPTCFNLRKYINKKYSERENAILHMGTWFYKNPITSIKAVLAMDSPAKLYITGKIEPYLKEIVSPLSISDQDRIVFPGFLSATKFRELIGTVIINCLSSIYL